MRAGAWTPPSLEEPTRVIFSEATLRTSQRGFARRTPSLDGRNVIVIPIVASASGIPTRGELGVRIAFIARLIHCQSKLAVWTARMCRSTFWLGRFWTIWDSPSRGVLPARSLRTRHPSPIAPLVIPIATADPTVGSSPSGKVQSHALRNDNGNGRYP
jgi:hypothetical protein